MLGPQRIEALHRLEIGSLINTKGWKQKLEEKYNQEIYIPPTG